MKTIIHLAMFAVILFASEVAMAANHYVRAGATGTNNGNDWANAFTSLPATLIRGDTYYIAGGNYPAYVFDDPVSGSTVITIKKAIASDHGTDTGWQSFYGTTQAVFNSILKFNTSNYIFDGQTRNESDWFDGASYGIQIFHSNQLWQNIIIGTSGSGAANNITIKHVYINAPYKNLPTTQTIRQYAIDTDTYGGPQHTGLVFTRMYVRGGNNIWFLRTTTGAVVEYSANDGASSNAANHGEIVNLYYSGQNAIIRYNYWKNAYKGGCGTALVAITFANGLEFYGNVAYNFDSCDAAVGFGGYSTSNNKIYNNTFILGGNYNAGTAFGSGTNNFVYNNLWISCTVNLAGTHDYNGFSDSNTRGEAHAITNVPTTKFINYSGGDFRLASATAAGITLPSPYNKDAFNNIRGSDGTWDRGAFEFGGSTSPAPVITILPPYNVRTTQ